MYFGLNMCCGKMYLKINVGDLKMPRVYVAAIMVCILGTLFVLQRQHSLTREFDQLAADFYEVESQLGRVNSIIANVETSFLDTSATSIGGEAILEEQGLDGFRIPDYFYCTDSGLSTFRVLQADESTQTFREWEINTEVEVFDPTTMRAVSGGSYILNRSRIVAEVEERGVVSRIGMVVNASDAQGNVLGFGDGGSMAFDVRFCPDYINEMNSF